ncbi:MAG: hypothetical protein U0R19_11110 [Bryobacteraceae bacterium]
MSRTTCVDLVIADADCSGGSGRIDRGVLDLMRPSCELEGGDERSRLAGGPHGQQPNGPAGTAVTLSE